MKKIVALVLSLVMVLGLATTAFAAADTYDLYQSDDGMAAAMKVGATAADYDAVEINEVAAKTNKDGSGNVAYLVIKDGGTTLYATKTTAPTVNSYAVCDADKTTILYYVNISTTANAPEYFGYAAVVTAFKDFGLKCGQVNTTADPAKDYFKYAVDGKVYEAGAATATVAANFLLDGAVVSGAVGYTVIDHTFVANDFKYDSTLKTNVPTAAICTTCLTTTTSIYLNAKVPATQTPYVLGNATGYSAVVGAVASAPAASDKVESAQTFDAGIAMYVGMSVMAAAGSAVVLKKKD